MGGSIRARAHLGALRRSDLVSGFLSYGEFLTSNGSKRNLRERPQEPTGPAEPSSSDPV